MNRKWWAGLLAALGIGAAVTVASARDITVSAATQDETAVFVASWRAASSQIAGCPTYRVTWTVAGVPTAGKTVTVLTDTLRVTRASGAAQTTASASVVAVCGSKTSAARSASRTVTWPVVTVPVDSTPGPVDSLRVDTIASGGPIIVPPPDTTTPPPPNNGAFVDVSHIPGGMRLWFDDNLSSMAQPEYANANGLRLYSYDKDWRTTDPTAPYSPGVVKQTYPGGDYGNGTGIGFFVREEGSYQRMYVAVEVKFEGSGGQPYKVHFNEEKFLFPVLNGPCGNSGPDFAIIARNGKVESHMQNGIGSPRLQQNGAATVPLGVWTKLEYYIQLNTPGNADGVWRMWVDGQVAANHTNVRYFNGTCEAGMFGFRFVSVRGGGADNGPTPPGGQSRVFDRLAVYVSESVR